MAGPTGAHHKVIHAPLKEFNAPDPLFLSILTRWLQQKVAAGHELQHVELHPSGFQAPHLALGHRRQAQPLLWPCLILSVKFISQQLHPAIKAGTGL